MGYFSLAPVAWASTNYNTGTTGIDISWPNCNQTVASLKPPAAFGIVGVNGGLDFTSNKCLGAEASLFRANPSLYINTGYPGQSYGLEYQSSPKKCLPKNYKCLAYNFGYNAGQYAVNYALEHGVVANTWWLDVEVINSWTKDKAVNTSALMGQVASIKDLAEPNNIGFYTYPTEWDTITSHWRNHLPSWVASDSNYRSVALSYCNKASFTGVKPSLVQYVGLFDYDFVCR